MLITDAQQEETDFDWFGVDEEGLIAHFTTAGFKRLPQSVAADAEGLGMVADYFLRQAPIQSGHQLDGGLPTAVPEWQGEQNEVKYLSSFVSMADKGLFSFDVPTYVKPGLAYIRVASPTNPLLLSALPEQIKSVLSRTTLKGVIS